MNRRVGERPAASSGDRLASSRSSATPQSRRPKAISAAAPTEGD
ncbi:hypothetical protein [Natrononativus amylolyticus]|nr:hypothetical protein [Natrononativus amylolyticus]